MSYETYKWLHIFCALCLFLAIGVLLSTYGNQGQEGDKHKTGSQKKVMILHGLSSFILFVSGFGLLARLDLHPFPIWAFIKIFVWLILALIVPLLLFKKPRFVFHKLCMFPKNNKCNHIGLWLIVTLSGLGAVLLAVLKPFS